MSEAERATESPPPSATRFNIRSLLWLMVGVALFASLAGMHVRGVEEKAQFSLSVYWLGTLCCFLFVICVQLVSRIRAEQRASDTLLIVPAVQKEPSGYFSSWYGFAFTLVITVWLAEIGASATVRFALEGRTLFRPILYGFVAGMFPAMILQEAWLQRTVWFSEKGFVWDTKFYRWNPSMWLGVPVKQGTKIEMRFPIRHLAATLDIIPAPEQFTQVTEFLERVKRNQLSNSAEDDDVAPGSARG